MTASNDLDRQLQAYLEASGPSDVRSEVVTSALDTARGLRQRRGPAAWVTGPGSWPVFAGRVSLRGLSPALRVGIAAAALLTLVGGSVFVGSRLMADTDPLPLRTSYNGAFESVGRTYGEGEIGPRSVAVLPDGRILGVTTTRQTTQVDGGDWVPSRIEAWDPRTGTLGDLGSTLKPRHGATVVALSDGRVLVVGGDISPPYEGEGTHLPATAEVFDPTTGTSEPAGPPPRSASTARRSGADIGFVAALLPDGRVLVAGGSGMVVDSTSGLSVSRSRGELETAEIYDPATNSWASAEPMTRGASGLAATRLSDGQLVFVQSNPFIPDPDTADLSRRIESYDPATGEFSNAGELAEPPAAPGVLLDDGRVLVAHGGCLAGFSWFSANSPFEGAIDGINPVSTEIFDPADGSLTDGPTLPHCVDTATALPDGKVLITGYWGEGGRISERRVSGANIGWAGLLDPRSGSVRVVHAPDRYGAVPTVLGDGSVLFVGGAPLNGDSTKFSWGQIFR